MQELTPEARRRVEDIAFRHGTSVDAALTLLRALVAGGGTMAQFSHPDLGGMGQWSRGGMTMVGDMFNNALKAKVDGLCAEIAGLLASQPIWEPPPESGGQAGFAGANWWGADLGGPSTSGAQNGVRYAWFPGARRLAIEIGGRVTLYDTGDHQIGGVSQQQGGDASLSFTSQYGQVRLGDLRIVSLSTDSAGWPPEPPVPWQPDADSRRQDSFSRQPEADAWQPAAAPMPAPAASDPAPDILLLIERLAALRDKNILSEEEFAAKKAELLSRL